MWDDSACRAAALDTPQEWVETLSERKAQIIPLELTAAGMLFTYQEHLRGRDVIFFIDNQSVCCALTKGSSRSWDIQPMCFAWHLFCLQAGCRVWIEWVPSESNPADILSRESASLYETTSGAIDTLLLPPWGDMRGGRNISEILDFVSCQAEANS